MLIVTLLENQPINTIKIYEKIKTWKELVKLGLAAFIFTRDKKIDQTAAARSESML